MRPHMAVEIRGDEEVVEVGILTGGGGADWAAVIIRISALL